MVVGKGDLGSFVESEQELIIQPAKVLAMNALDEIGEALREKGLSLENLME